MSRRNAVSRDRLIATIRLVQTRLTWKPGKAESHLKQRIRRGHLPATATLDAYETIIQAIVRSPNARVYIFWHEETPYVSIIDTFNENHWLVMFALNGILESAYIVERPERYLNNGGFEFINSLSKLMENPR